MVFSPTEQQIRAGLPLIRFMQTGIPLPLARLLIKQGMSRVDLGADLLHAGISADDVPCTWIVPQNHRPDQVLLYLHGGGFVFGMTPPHLQMGAYLAKKMGMRLLMVDYRLAPEAPFPAALADCFTSYRWLLDQGILPQNIVVAGDSAGGNLTITLLMKLRDSSMPLPAAAACLSPVTDLTLKAKGGRGFKDPLLPPKAVAFYTQAYVGSHDAHDPLVSPVYGDLHNFPPLLLHAGEDEILREDAVRIAALAKSAGVDVRLEIFPRMWHVWQINLSLPQARRSLDDIAQFFKKHLGSESTPPDPT